MTIMSNGPRGQASLDVYTEYANHTHRIVKATVKINGVDYTASVQVVTGTCVHIVLTSTRQCGHCVNLHAGALQRVALLRAASGGG